MATHAVNTGHEFLDITNMILIKHISHKGTIMNTWTNLQIYNHETPDKLIPEQMQINTKHEQFSKHLTFETLKKQKYIPVSYTHLDVYKRQLQEYTS